MAVKEILVLGGGVGGTLCANLVAKRSGRQGHVTLVDTTGWHLFQPGLLYVAVGRKRPAALARPEASLLRPDVTLIVDRARRIEPRTRKVLLASGRTLDYDMLVVATGSRTVMEEIPGAKGAHDFYSIAGAVQLFKALEAFDGGTIAIGVAGFPYKCPPAPVEFAFLLDDYLRARGIRERSKIKLLSPFDRAFTVESSSKLIEPILAEREIELTTLFSVLAVDAIGKTVSSVGGQTEPYDILVLVPPHRGQKLIEDSGLGDERGWLPVDPKTLLVKGFAEIWAIGDATDISIAMSGSVAHYEAVVAAAEIVAAVTGDDNPTRTYDGKVVSFLETGRGQATTIRSDYTHPAGSPRPARAWHWGKALFSKAYWHTVPRGRLP